MFIRFLKAAGLCAALYASSLTSPAQKVAMEIPFNPSGISATAWVSGYSSAGQIGYPQGQWVQRGTQLCFSLKFGNTGDPATDTTDWDCSAPAGGGPTLQTNGNQNGSQSKLNLKAGANVSLSDDGSGDVTVAATGGSSPAGYADAGSSLTSALSSCTSALGVQISQNITVNSNVTVPATCPLKFVPGGELLPASGYTVTINGTIESPRWLHIFGGAGSIALGANVTSAPAEWFGATLNTGDSTAAIQAAINALQVGEVSLSAGTYNTSATLVVSKSRVGIGGVGGGWGSYQGIGSTINNTASSDDIIDFGGTSSSPTVGNVFHDFYIARSVLPTGSAKGLACNFAGGALVDRLNVSDSMYDTYWHGCPSYTLGHVSQVQADWNLSGYTSTSSNPTYGNYLDSQDGNAENSLYLYQVGVSGGAPGGYTIGNAVIGTAINDINWVLATTGGGTVDIGLLIKYTGNGTAFDSAMDLHFMWAQLDACKYRCVDIENFPKIGSAVFTDMYSMMNPGANAGVFLNNSYGVQIIGGELESNSTSAGSNVYINNGGNNQIVDAHLTVVSGNSSSDIIGVANSPGNAITGNSFLLPNGSVRSFVGVYGASSGTIVDDNTALGSGTYGLSVGSDATGTVLACLNNFPGATSSTNVASSNASISCAGGSTSNAAPSNGAYVPPTYGTVSITTLVPPSAVNLLASQGGKGFATDDHHFAIHVATASSGGLAANTAIATVTMGETWVTASGVADLPACSPVPLGGSGSQNATELAMGLTIAPSLPSSTSATTTLTIYNTNAIPASTDGFFYVTCSGIMEQAHATSIPQ